MLTRIINIKTKEETTIVTQQYEVGLYVIQDNDPSRQGSVQTKEKPFHQKIRNKVDKDPEYIWEG